nr:putative mscs family protein c2c4.17c [Quercus suber]
MLFNDNGEPRPDAASRACLDFAWSLVRLLTTAAIMAPLECEITVINEMADLENGNDKKFGHVTVTSVDSSERPVLGRRKTTGSLQQNVTDETSTALPTYDGEEDTLTKIGNLLWKVHSASVLTRYALYILPVAMLLAIPLITLATLPGEHRAGNTPLLGLFIWIEVLWVSLWVCKLFAQATPIIFQAACGLISTGIRKYSLVLMALEIPISLLLWTIVGFCTSSPLINLFRDSKFAEDHWVSIVAKIFKAGIIVACIFVIEKTFIQVITINYHRKQYDQKIRESKKLTKILDHLYDASRKIFPEFCREFQEEDAEIQGNTLTEVRNTLARAGVHTRLLSDMGRVRDKMTAAFGAMASDISGKQVFNTSAAHSIVLEALETERASKALARRLWLSFVGEGRDVLSKRDLVEVLGAQHADEVDEIFTTLDRDGNGDVSLEEMTMLVLGVGTERKNRAVSMHDISQAIAVLDKMLSLAVLVAIAFIYATFFSATFAAKTTQLWTSFTGLAFAIGGTVTEFLASCIFLFVKHPYDVGDRVTINDAELIVEHISLMYSVFRRVDSDATLQIPHNVANGLWIENITRSKCMKERLSINVAATTSMEDILALRGELAKFVAAEARDFQPDFDIELRNLGDMKSLELRVEIRHKRLRNVRRNKFMVELLASMRRIPIEPPGGSNPPLGDPSNPSYNVSVSDREATDARKTHSDKHEAARLFPKGSSLADLMPDAISSGFRNPAQAMFSSMTGRSHSIAEGAMMVGRRSIDSTRQ